MFFEKLLTYSLSPMFTRTRTEEGGWMDDVYLGFNQGLIGLVFNYPSFVVHTGKNVKKVVVP